MREDKYKGLRTKDNVDKYKEQRTKDMPVPCKLYFVNNVKREKLIKDLKDFKGIRALRLKLYLELSFRILKIILRLNFKFHFEPEATPL